MGGSPKSRQRLLEAIVVGTVALGVLLLPPLNLAARADRSLFDLWSQLSLGHAPADLLVVEIDDIATVDQLAWLGRRHGANLLVTTAPEPPSEHANGLMLGPTELPSGNARLRSTAWRQGGHLWLAPDPIDGVVRSDRSELKDSPPIPSLALAAARRLAQSTAAPPALPPATPLTAAHDSTTNHRWLRFYAPGSLSTATASELAATPSVATGKVLITGPGEPRYPTPVGLQSAPMLVAQALAGYRDGQEIRSSPLIELLSWAASMLVLVAVWRSAPAYGYPLAIAVIGSAGLAIVASGAFILGRIWLPLTAPIGLLLTVSSLLASQGRRRNDQRDARDSGLLQARRLAASGALQEAWSLYHQLPANAALLPELYALATALDSSGHAAEAADLYYRIAQTDSGYRDTARRLVTANHPEAATTDEARDLMPSLLGRYELLEPVGRGAMGYVYLGRDPIINRLLAIKAIDLAAEFDIDELEVGSRRFMLEAATAGRLSHPNIVTIYDVGETAGLAYIAMEYLKGRRLSDFTAPDRLLPVSTTLELLARTADALDYAHAQNVVHRDIKPANIMYDSTNESVKITDFSIARLIDVDRTRTGIVLGTPAFMSPEQLKGKNVNGHTDLFALGVSLFELLTGHLPFRGASMTTLMFAIANEPHPAVTSVRAGLPAWLDAIFARALAKAPADRYRNGAEMAAALRAGAARLR